MNDKPTTTIALEEPPTPHPSGAWDRSDYVRQYDKLSQDFAKAEESRKANAALYERAVAERDEARKVAEIFRGCAEIKFGTMPFPRKFPWEIAKTQDDEQE